MVKMNYAQTIDYLYGLLPVFHRIGGPAYKANLDNTWRLMEYLGHPETKFRSIHIAGTNGKGSVAHLLASVMQEHGFKTGLHTSPHLIDFRERIKVDGKLVPEDEVVDFVVKHKAFIEKLMPSFFELSVAMTFHYFARQQVDIAIIETGMGGRLDSTNVLKPELSIITNIGMDHAQFLGDSLEKIAGEKAGIIKRNVPAVIGRKQPEIIDVFEKCAEEKKSHLVFAEDLFQYSGTTNNAFEFVPQTKGVISTPITLKKNILGGQYQQENAVTVLSALEVLNQKSWFNLSQLQVQAGFDKVITNTDFAGRWQVLQNNPLVICDTAHNEDGLVQVLNQLQDLKRKIHFVLGFVSDKEVDKILGLFPKNGHTYYFTKADIIRALEPDVLSKMAHEKGISGIMHYKTISDAYKKALQNAASNDLVFVGGSNFVVGEFLKLAKKT